MYHLATVLPYFNQITTEYTLPNARWTKVCQPNPYRAIVYFSQPGSASVALNNSPQTTFNLGLFFIGASQSFRLTWSEDGPMSTLEWWASPGSSGVPSTLLVTEVLWQPP